MNRTLLALAIFLASSFPAEASPQRLIAFQRDSDIWVANLDGAGAKKITRGSYPDLSGDGARITFNTDTSKRQIAIADVATKRVKVFKGEIPSENCYRPVWSPDASQIIFKIWTGNEWHLALIKADGSGFRYVKKAGPNRNFFNSAVWATDGQSFYAQDMSKLYQFSLEGKELKSWDLRTLFPNGSFSSNTHIAVSPNGKSLLMEVDMDEEAANMPDWEGPPPALWTLDIASKKATRLTPNGLMAWSGCWVDNERILFTSQTANEKQTSICEMTLAEKNRKPILKNANSPTVSR